MKLQKIKKRIRGKKYYEYNLSVPPNMVSLLKLENGELSWELNDNGRLEVVKKPKEPMLRDLREVVALIDDHYPVERYIRPKGYGLTNNSG